jgi:hypothetical protein
MFYLTSKRGPSGRVVSLNESWPTRLEVPMEAVSKKPVLIFSYADKGFAVLPASKFSTTKESELNVVMTSGNIRVDRDSRTVELLPALRNLTGSGAPTRESPTGRVLFAEDFRDPSLKQWQKGLERTLKVEVDDGILRMNGIGVLFAKGTEGLNDYVMESVLRSNPSSDTLVSLLWRAQPPTPRGYGINEKGYSMQYEKDTMGLLFMASPQFYPRDPQVKMKLDAGWHTVRIECSGNLHRCYMDRRLVFSFRDDRYRSGGVGLSVTGNAQVKSVRILELGADLDR